MDKDAAADMSSRSGGNSGGNAGIIPPEVRLIGGDELDFGGKVCMCVRST